MDVYVARQPIFDREKHLHAYEFLFRDGLSNAFPDIDGDTATSRLLANTFFTIGIDRLAGRKKFFVNFTRALLIKRVPTMFPPDRLVVEILEDVEPEPDLVEACREIAAAGYTVALDDFLFRPELKPLIELAHIIKIDLRQTPTSRAEKLIQALGGHQLTFLAEKVETYEEFEQAREMGFALFQGYFFSKPEIVQGKAISPAKITLLQLIRETRRPDCDIDGLDRFINRDVSLSYKLLRYINSTFFRRRMEITSIRHAITLLGERELRQFIALVATAELAQDKPQELIRSTIIRARFCELLGEQSRSPMDTSELFLLGLLSQIDAMLDTKMSAVMETLPLSDRLKNALVSGTGALAGFLDLVTAYESGDWKNCTRLIESVGCDPVAVPDHYMEAVEWADAYSKL
ncbi:MAG: HDOD domain-containing protein [Desulfobacterales bacterium]|nr:HDOD domain-containing protein [Desulfobacterales bacterium]